VRAGAALALIAVALVAGAAVGDGFRPFGIGSESSHRVVITRTVTAPAPAVQPQPKPKPRPAKTKPRRLYRLKGAGRTRGAAWMAGNFAHPRLYVRYICPRKADGCVVGLGPNRTRIAKPLADIAAHTGSIVEKPVVARAMLIYPWLLVSKHLVRHRRFRERIILRVRAPRLLDDLAILLRTPAG
jgi:hypothetical protein